MFKRFKEWLANDNRFWSLDTSTDNLAGSRQYTWKFNFAKENYWMRDRASDLVIPLSLPFRLTVQDLESMQMKLYNYLHSDKKQELCHFLKLPLTIGDVSYNAAIIYGDQKYNEGGYCLTLTPRGRRVITHCLFLEGFNISKV